MKAFCTLLKNELKLNIRNMNMVIFAVILPLVVLVILGFLYGASPAADGVDYSFLEQSLGALCAISVCAGGLMGLPLVVAEYRERKILKRFHLPQLHRFRVGVEAQVLPLRPVQRRQYPRRRGIGRFIGVQLDVCLIPGLFPRRIGGKPPERPV